MVPARSRLLLHHDSKRPSGNSSSCPQYCITTQLEASAGASRHRHHQTSRFPRVAMADDDAAGTSSRGGGGGEDDGKDWLQLGLAAATSSSSSTAPAVEPPAPTELDLFANKQYNGRTSSPSMMRPPLFPLPIFRSYHYGHGRYRPTTSGSGSMPPPPPPPFLPFARPLRSPDDPRVRVISPPRRTEAAGLWLTLLADPDQVREPILPQIPKSYLRIKDSNVKVEVVMKYLASKLGLTHSHLQVELTCRGQLLPPFLLVKNVRDSIWSSSSSLGPSWDEEGEEEDGFVELPGRQTPASDPTSDHVMTLFYSSRMSYH
ncbi:hypothetical protein GUJ93_ZPchr0001g32929 [Zizania palustris]|uniref:Uncharacterized protein n=1 Tax=Zizania palustris TaxID=103762 RepID=A0A8J5RYF2_ZIZPA|nr:hypothetical protein GUJ93_ZPchr0001g32929 [Zizania palustris]